MNNPPRNLTPNLNGRYNTRFRPHEHKFRHCFPDTLNPLCESIKNIESKMHFRTDSTNFSFLDEHSFRKLRTLMITFYLKAKRN